MAIVYNRRCSLCGQKIIADRETLLEDPRFENDESLVDDFIAGNQHVCREDFSSNLIGPKSWWSLTANWLADEGLDRPELRWLIEAELERRQAAGQPAWTVFVVCIREGTRMATTTTKVVRCPAGCLHPVGDHSPEPVDGRVGCCAPVGPGRCPCTWAPPALARESTPWLRFVERVDSTLVFQCVEHDHGDRPQFYRVRDGLMDGPFATSAAATA